MTNSFELAHMSDSHIGLSQYPVTAGNSGRNQREQDLLRAFLGCIDDINAWDPPLVIHSGDVAEKPVITYRQQRQIQEGFVQMTRRKDGSPRLIVVISGNHDMPRDPREPCHLEPALRPLPSVVCVTNRYAQVHLDDYIADGLASPELAGVVVHCLPHDQLKRSDWDEIAPIPGKVNILTSHGVVGGSELYRRSLGREYAIPIDVLTRGWAYVALGHYHKPGPVAVGGMKEDSTVVYYAGSAENCGFSDLRDGIGGRGYMQVQVNPGELPDVKLVQLAHRAMFRLPVIDAAGMTYEQITDALIAHAKEADLLGAVVDQKVTNVHRDTWSLVDIGAARRAASAALWYQVTPMFSRGTASGEETAAEQVERLGDIGLVLGETATALVPDEVERNQILSMARTLLGTALSDGPDDGSQDPKSEEPAGAAPTASSQASGNTEGTAPTTSGQDAPAAQAQRPRSDAA